MTSISLHSVKGIKVERLYLKDTKTHVLNMFIETERFGDYCISFFADEIGNLQIIHKEAINYGKPTIEDLAEAERKYPTSIKTLKCIDCGRLLKANEYGGLYCPKCFDGRVQEEIEDTNGGYY